MRHRLHSIALFGILFFGGSQAYAQSACRDIFVDVRVKSYSEFPILKDKRTSYHTNELPIVNVDEQITQQRVLTAQQLGAGGGNHIELRAGKLNGHEVFIKFCGLHYRGRRGISEASFAKLMSDLELGPKFHGVAVKSHEIVGFVTDFVSGTSLKHEDLTGRDRRKSEIIQSFLYDIGIFPTDLQYRLLHGRLWIVDTGEFSISQSQALKPEEMARKLHKILRLMDYR